MNVTLTTKCERKLTKKQVFKSAWKIYREENITFKHALKIAWSEYNGVYVRTFWTNAEAEDIAWTIHTCTRENTVRRDLIANHDSFNIKHVLDWVSYHLRRNGFEICDYKENDYIVEYNNIPAM